MAAPTARLLETAATQHGLFTTAQAEAVNVRPEQVRRMVAHGDLEHRAYGVYRIPTVPFDEYTELMEAVLWANGRGTIVGESALLLWDLADVNPRKIHIAVPPPYRPRRKDGDLYRVHQMHLTDADLDETHGVPVVTPALAIRQAIELGVPGDLVRQAIRRATAREYIGEQTASTLLALLQARSLGGKAKAHSDEH